MASTRFPVVLLVCGMALATSVRPADAARLFQRALGTPSTAPGIARVQAMGIDPGGLASLRASDRIALSDFPLGADGTATITLERFEPFTAQARAVVVDPEGPRDIAFPDQRYYRGTVEGDPTSRVVLVAASDTARGFVATGGTIYRFGRDRSGVHRSWSMRDVDAAAYPGPGAFCDADAARALVSAHPGRVATAAATAAAPPTSGFSPTLLAQVAVDTDQELLAHFGGDLEAALAYLVDLAASISAIYDADTDVRVKFSFIRLWNTPDPWTATSTTVMLSELKTYWDANEGATPRDVAHFVSGKSVVGGLAYLDVLCDPAFGYGVSTVFGSLDVMDPNETWDVIVVSHELGHNFGSPHTHCYMPPVDGCHNDEAGCYAGTESLPPGGGTIMSYCHQLPGGITNVNLTFGPTVSAVLRAGAEAGVCIGPPCGDGILDVGEDCDDGNNVNGDCCSGACLAEPDGGGCDDDESCTSGDQCAAGACVGTPVIDGTPCDDGSLCTTDACQSGACVGDPVPAPSAGCKVPTLPLKSQLVLKDKEQDKSDQVTWKWTKGQDTTFGELGDPATSDTYQLCVYGPGPALLFSGRAPAGGTCADRPCWKANPLKGYAYKDKDRTPDCMDQVKLGAGIDGRAKVSAKGKGTLLDMPALGSLATPIEVRLHGAGQCWAATYSTAIVNTTEQFKAKSD